jgi:hypothetical protein
MVQFISTTQDGILYTRTFPLVETSDQPPVIIECKLTVGKLKGILRNHSTTVPNISPFDDLCDSIVVDDIKKEDVLDNKPIWTTQYQCYVQWETFINTTGSIFKNQG